MKRNIKQGLINRTIQLVTVQKTEAILMMISAGFLSAIGFFFGITHENSNYELMFGFMSQYLWAMLFFIYASVKSVGLFFEVNYIAKVINGVVGLWAWVYMFLSFTFFDQAPLTPTEILLLMPVVVQSWLILSTVYWGTHNKNTRSNL